MLYRYTGYYYSRAAVVSSTAKQSTILVQERKENPRIDFLIVIAASGIAQGCDDVAQNGGHAPANRLPRHTALDYSIHF